MPKRFGTPWSRLDRGPASRVNDYKKISDVYAWRKYHEIRQPAASSIEPGRGTGIGPGMATGGASPAESLSGPGHRRGIDTTGEVSPPSKPLPGPALGLRAGTDGVFMVAPVAPWIRRPAAALS
jgi:hypothetical protein